MPSSPRLSVAAGSSARTCTAGSQLQDSLLQLAGRGHERDTGKPQRVWQQLTGRTQEGIRGPHGVGTALNKQLS